MPLSEEDEVFVEKCFQRSLLVSMTEGICFMNGRPRGPAVLFLPTANHVFPLGITGAGEADLLQRYPNLRVETNGRNLPRWRRILFVDGVVQGRTA